MTRPPDLDPWAGLRTWATISRYLLCAMALTLLVLGIALAASWYL